MSASNEWLWWMLGGGASLGALVYGVFEYLKWLERTQVFQSPTGLIFVAHAFRVETNRTRKQILVRTDLGRYTQAPTEKMPEQEKTGPLQVTLSALGLRMSVSPVMQDVASMPSGSVQGATIQVPTAQCTITFNNSEEKTEVVILKLPAKAGLAFEEFARQIAVWIDKLEERRATDNAVAAKLTEKTDEPEKTVLDDAEGTTSKEPDVGELTAEDQIAYWRKTAGFKGKSSEIGLDENGKIAWFIDLDPTGRIILHSDQCTAFASLLGGEIVSLGGELKVTVRGASWTEGNPETQSFRLFKGRSPDERRAWKERLEILRDEMQADSAVRQI